MCNAFTTYAYVALEPNNVFRNVESHYFSYSGSDKQCFNREFASKSGSPVEGMDLPTAYMAWTLPLALTKE